MILKLLVRAIREHDRDGNLVVAGVEWVEQRMWAVLTIGPVVAVGSIACVWGLAYGIAQGFTSGPVAASVGGLIVTFCGMAILLKSVMRKRSILFHVDGSIRVPNGLPGMSGFVLKHTGFIRHPQIRSIEVGQDSKHGVDVRIYSDEGDKVVVGRSFFEPDFAHKIAVMLQTALHDIRRGYADGLQEESEEQIMETGERMRAAMASVHPGDTVHITID